MEITSNSTSETKKIGEIFAKEVMKTKKKKALVIILEGELGSGKTSFVQGFARGLGIKSKVLSPTFNIFKKFPIRKQGQFKFLFHFDCYRIKNSREIAMLGFEEIIKNLENIVIIEWGNKIKRLISKDSINFRFKVTGKNQRSMKVQVRLVQN